MAGKRATSVRPNAFAVLTLLLENAGSLVTKQQVLDMIWPGIFVGDAVLKDNIRQLRKLPHYWPEAVAAHADGAKY
jgi:DNA-binding winged helix-turn-helix (wHTH) protein